MMNATAVIDELRPALDGEWARYRDLPFPARISDTISLSTFHGCPAREIEGIVTFLLAEMGCQVCIKLNPTLLGRDEVEHLLHDVLGYHELEVHPPAFENDLQFDEALDLIPRLQGVARAHGRNLSVKFTNTLVVKNHKGLFSEGEMYLSGAPLHVIALNLVKKFREHQREPTPVSFSGGLDANNVARAVAMNFVPVTSCTDLLRPGGYGRMIRYLENLGAAMRELGVNNIGDFVLQFRGQAEAAAGNVNAAGLLNTPILVAEATADPRYRWERNQGVPRKIGSKLWLYDCITCDKCVPVCPNDANFVYETGAVDVAYDNFELGSDGPRAIPGGVLRLVKARQFANYADACNDCGNCDIFCPEDGGPFVEKPRFFGSLETFHRDAGRNGFYIDHARTAIHGVIAGEAYILTVDRTADRARFERDDTEIEIRLSDNRALHWTPRNGAMGAPRTLDMLPYLKLKLLLESISDPRHAHFANVDGLPAVTHGGEAHD
jgi:putative selenate reductase